MAWVSRDQDRALERAVLDPLGQLESAVSAVAPWDSIIDFATHPYFCGKRLYPRQRTLLRLIYLEVDQMTQYDLDVIEQWRVGFADRSSPCGVQSDIWQRIQFLRDNGYRHFPHILACLGRRASKGMLGGVLGAETLAYMYSLNDWQAHYGLDPGIEGELTVVATSQSQAARRQFADIRRSVESCKYLRPAIASNKGTELTIRTPADVRRIAELRASGVPIDREIASLRAQAVSSSSASGRGGAGFANFYDEFAHVLSGSGSVKSSEEIYEAYQPSLDQFGKDSLTYIPSSPYCLEPSTRVLTEDLRWVPVGSLLVGDKLIGFDEHLPGGKGKGRCWRPATVTDTSVIHTPRQELVLESGKRITCTGEHLWLARRSQWDYGWIKTSDLRPGDTIKTLGVDPWDTDESRGAGYLAGFFDGEGSVSGGLGNSKGLCALAYTQNYGVVQEHVEQLLKERHFAVQTSDDRQGKLARSRIMGGVAEMLRFLGTVRPERLLAKFPEKFYGGRIYGPLDKATDRVVAVLPASDGPVIALETSTATLIAEGLLSHNTMTGKFYELFKQGAVVLPEGEDGFRREQSVDDLDEDDVLEAQADPEMLVIQVPSWELYKDWERSPQIPVVKPAGGEFKKGPRFKRPIQWPPDGDKPENLRMRLLERRNPEKFGVERRAKFANVMDAYLDPDAVDRMFAEPGWRPPLAEQDRGYLTRVYRVHCDPSKSGANFACAIGHLEEAPPDEHGEVWPHVVFDWLHVWKPEDFPLDETGKHRIDYVTIQRRLEEVLTRYPSAKRVTFDQWNSAGMISHLQHKFSPRMTIAEETATAESNRRRAERFKSALNLGWVHCLAGETGVLTPDGVRPIRDLAGTTARLLTTSQNDGRGGGKWVEAPVRSFGVQPLLKVTLRRNGVDKIIHATAGHRWFVRQTNGTASHRQEVLTADLRPGQRLSYCYAQRHKATRPSPIGIAHGFTYGDGTRSRKGSVAQFCGDKDKALIPYFDLHPIVDIAPGVRRALDLPRFFKEKVDLTESPSYLYGWLAGYMAADGHVTKDGRVEIDSNDRSSLEHVRAVCNLLGIHTTSIRTKNAYGHGYKPDGKGYATNLDVTALTEEFFLTDEHRQRWLDNQDKQRKDYRGYTVVAVEETDRVEEVFCAVVDGTQSFTLEDNILTGNCYRDSLNGEEGSLLEMELKFLTEKNGRVDRQQFGPCTTKDLADCVMTVASDLLHNALDRWSQLLIGATSFGSTDVAGMRSGRELERAAAMLGQGGDRSARAVLSQMRQDRTRGLGARAGGGYSASTRGRRSTTGRSGGR